MALLFVCPAPPEPAGGVEKIYQFVAALESAGVEAAVVHPSGARPIDYWFDSTATVLRAEDVLFDLERDVLVVPELWAFDVHLPSEAKLIILNQGAYLTFAGRPLPEPASELASLDPGPYRHERLLGVVCVSADSQRYLEFAFPHVEVRRIHIGIDAAVFSPGPQWRDAAFAFMPRRRSSELGELLRILASRGRCSDWRLEPIEGLDHRRVAAVLRSSPIFLNFPIREGFPLPPLEAMACGCIVVGYTGRGGDEYLLPGYSFPIAEGDSIEYARVVEEVVREYEGKGRELTALTTAAVELIASEYTLDRQHREVVEAFTGLIHSEGSENASATSVRLDEVLAGFRVLVPSRGRKLARRVRRGVRAFSAG